MMLRTCCVRACVFVGVRACAVTCANDGRVYRQYNNSARVCLLSNPPLPLPDFDTGERTQQRLRLLQPPEHTPARPRAYARITI